MVSTLRALTSFTLVASALLAGCSGTDGRPPLADTGEVGGAGGAAAGGAAGSEAGAGGASVVCNDGATRKCKVKLPTQSGVTNCFVGVEVCEAGQWGPCRDPNDVRGRTWTATNTGGAGGAG